MTAKFGTSNSLRSTRAVAIDAALGRGTGKDLDGDRLSRLGRLSPSAVASRLGKARFPIAPPRWPDSVPRPQPEPELGAHYDTEWSRRYPVRLARAMVLDNLARPLARVLASPVVRGDEGLTGLSGSVIFAANHASHVDTPLLLSCLPLRFRHRTVVAAAADYFFDRRWKADAWSFLLAAIPFERNKVNRRSAEVAVELLADGWNLIIFPEGGRSPDGWGQTFTGGAAYLAARTGATVVPVHMDGTRHILPKGGTGLRRTRTSITFGTPMKPDGDEQTRRFAARIEAAVATMADEATSDWWSARKRAAQGSTPPLQGPDVAPWRRSWLLTPAPPSPGRRDSDDRDGSAPWPRQAKGS